MGKRTENDLDSYIDGYMDDIDSEVPIGAGTDSFPIYPERPIVAEDSMQRYPFRRNEIKVAHIFGRQLADELENGGPFQDRLFNDEIDGPQMPYLGNGETSDLQYRYGGFFGQMHYIL